MAVWILSEVEQVELVALYRTGYLTQKQLGDYFNVSSNTVGKVLRLRNVPRDRAQVTVPQACILDFCKRHNLNLLKIQQAFNLVEA